MNKIQKELAADYLTKLLEDISENPLQDGLLESIQEKFPNYNGNEVDEIFNEIVFKVHKALENVKI